MSWLAPKNLTFSIIGILIGGIVGYFIGSDVEGGELLWPITLVGCIAGLILGGVLRVIVQLARKKTYRPDKH